MNDIIYKLLTDGTLTNLIGYNHIYPHYTTYMGDCIVYEYNTVSYNKLVSRQRLKITIIASDLVKADAIEKAVCNKIVTFGDNEITNTKVLKSEVNGGGTLFDTERNKVHRILYFDLIMR